MGHYGPLWATMDHYGPLWTTMDHYGPLWTTMGHYGPLWTTMDHYGPLWTTMDHYGPLWTTMDHYGPLSDHLATVTTPIALSYNQSCRSFISTYLSGSVQGLPMSCVAHGRTENNMFCFHGNQGMLLGLSRHTLLMWRP